MKFVDVVLPLPLSSVFTYALPEGLQDAAGVGCRVVVPFGAKKIYTGIVMEVYTSQPGVQLYTGNWMTGNFVGKNGQRYPERAALCLETQHFPDSPNKPEYPSTVLRPGEVFESRTTYKFSTEQ